MQTKLSLIPIALLLTACADSGSSSKPSSPSAIVGRDMSGNYSLTGYSCVDQAGNLTNTSSIANGAVITAVIAGNSITSTIQHGLCTIVISGQIAFTTDVYYSATNRVVSSATDGSCTASVVLDSPAISPNTDTMTASTGQQVADAFDKLYIYDEINNQVSFFTTLSDGNGGVCLAVYQKQ